MIDGFINFLVASNIKQARYKKVMQGENML